MLANCASSTELLTGAGQPNGAPHRDHAVTTSQPAVMKRSLLSVVIPVFNEEETIPELYSRLTAAVPLYGFEDVELIFVSDGSTDRTEPILTELARRDPRLKVVILSRNFGHQAAVTTGLKMSRGTVVAIIDGDLQDPPEAIALLLEELARGTDVAFGVRTHRKEHLLKRAAYASFYRLLKRIAEIDIPLDSGDFCCMTRQVVDALHELPERNRFVRGLRAWVGFRQVGVPYEREPRFAGQPKYNLRKLMQLAFDGLFAFSGLPVRLIQILGFLASTMALAIAFGYLALYFVNRAAFPTGFATLAISIWFLGGIQLLFLGIVGEYVIRTMDETRGRPVCVVRQVISFPSNEERA